MEQMLLARDPSSGASIGGYPHCVQRCIALRNRCSTRNGPFTDHLIGPIPPVWRERPYGGGLWRGLRMEPLNTPTMRSLVEWIASAEGAPDPVGSLPDQPHIPNTPCMTADAIRGGLRRGLRRYLESTACCCTPLSLSNTPWRRESSKRWWQADSRDHVIAL